MKNNPYQSYKQQSVMTMTQGDMLTLLYDGVLKELAFAQAAFLKQDNAEINRALQKAQKILGHLQRTLDDHYDISKNLAALYDYFIHVVVQANVKKDVSALDEVVTMISELRNTFKEADRKSRVAVVGR